LLGSRTISLTSTIANPGSTTLALIPEGLRRSTRALRARIGALARRVATLAENSFDAPAERRPGRSQSPATPAKRRLAPWETPHASRKSQPGSAERRDARPKASARFDGEPRRSRGESSVVRASAAPPRVSVSGLRWSVRTIKPRVVPGSDVFALPAFTIESLAFTTVGGAPIGILQSPQHPVGTILGQWYGRPP
jgi:hypothetical protein